MLVRVCSGGNEDLIKTTIIRDFAKNETKVTYYLSYPEVDPQTLILIRTLLCTRPICRIDSFDTCPTECLAKCAHAALNWERLVNLVLHGPQNL